MIVQVSSPSADSVHDATPVLLTVVAGHVMSGVVPMVELLNSSNVSGAAFVRSGEPPELGVTCACSVTLVVVVVAEPVEKNRPPVYPSVPDFLAIVSVPFANESV